MSLKFPDLGYQFFSNVLKGKGVDQPTIDFVWEQGESLFLWQQWFGEVTRDGMRKLGELTEVINVEPKNMPPLRGQGVFKFNEIRLDLSTGKVTYTDSINRTSMTSDIEGGSQGISPGQVVFLSGIKGEVKVRVF